VDEYHNPSGPVFLGVINTVRNFFRFFVTSAIGILILTSFSAVHAAKLVSIESPIIQEVRVKATKNKRLSDVTVTFSFPDSITASQKPVVRIKASRYQCIAKSSIRKLRKSCVIRNVPIGLSLKFFTQISIGKQVGRYANAGVRQRIRVGLTWKRPVPNTNFPTTTAPAVSAPPATSFVCPSGTWSYDVNQFQIRSIIPTDNPQVNNYSIEFAGTFTNATSDVVFPSGMTALISFSPNLNNFLRPYPSSPAVFNVFLNAGLSVSPGQTAMVSGGGLLESLSTPELVGKGSARVIWDDPRNVANCPEPGPG